MNDSLVYNAIADLIAQHHKEIDRVLNDPDSPFYEDNRRWQMRRRAISSSAAREGKSKQAIRWRAQRYV
jgi:hypothetical protein